MYKKGKTTMIDLAVGILDMIIFCAVIYPIPVIGMIIGVTVGMLLTRAR